MFFNKLSILDRRMKIKKLLYFIILILKMNKYYIILVVRYNNWHFSKTLLNN